MASRVEGGALLRGVLAVKIASNNGFICQRSEGSNVIREVVDFR